VTRENEGTADEYLNVRASIDEPSAFDATRASPGISYSRSARSSSRVRTSRRRRRGAAADAGSSRRRRRARRATWRTKPRSGVGSARAIRSPTRSTTAPASSPRGCARSRRCAARDRRAAREARGRDAADGARVDPHRIRRAGSSVPRSTGRRATGSRATRSASGGHEADGAEVADRALGEWEESVGFLPWKVTVYEEPSAQRHAVSALAAGRQLEAEEPEAIAAHHARRDRRRREGVGEGAGGRAVRAPRRRRAGRGARAGGAAHDPEGPRGGDRSDTGKYPDRHRAPPRSRARARARDGGVGRRHRLGGHQARRSPEALAPADPAAARREGRRSPRRRDHDPARQRGRRLAARRGADPRRRVRRAAAVEDGAPRRLARAVEGARAPGSEAPAAHARRDAPKILAKAARSIRASSSRWRSAPSSGSAR
jgi:hypothetical protein